MQPRSILAILVILDHSLIFGVIIPDAVLIQLSSWGWAHSCSKHVEDSNKHIIEETVRQVDYLPELYEDARFEKYKILIHMFMRNLWLRPPVLIQFFKLLFEGKLPLSIASEFKKFLSNDVLLFPSITRVKHVPRNLAAFLCCPYCSFLFCIKKPASSSVKLTQKSRLLSKALWNKTRSCWICIPILATDFSFPLSLFTFICFLLFSYKLAIEVTSLYFR